MHGSWKCMAKNYKNGSPSTGAINPMAAVSEKTILYVTLDIYWGEIIEKMMRFR